MVAEYKRRGGRCCTNAGWIRVSAVGADQIHPKGQYTSAVLGCIEQGLNVVVLRSRTITRRLRSK